MDESAHHALANAGGREIVGKKEGEQKGSARGSVHWGCYYATALDIEVDPQLEDSVFSKTRKILVPKQEYRVRTGAEYIYPLTPSTSSFSLQHSWTVFVLGAKL